MNSLSWFLYLVDVFGNVGWMFATLFIIGCIMMFITLAGCILSPDKKDSYGNPVKDYEEKSEAHWKAWKKWLKFSLWVFFTSFFLSALTPSEKTMYLILGSEAAEEAVDSETGRRIQRIINEKLDDYLSTADEVIDKVNEVN